MSLSNLFSVADSRYQALVKNPPRGGWSIVIFASFSWPWWANDVTLFGVDPNAAPVLRGRIEYSPSQAVETKVGNRSILLLTPAKFSGQITATTEFLSDAGTQEYSHPPVSVSISAPTALNFQAGKYQVETTGQDPLGVGSLNVDLEVTDALNVVTVNTAANIPGGVEIFLQDAAYNQPTLTLWGYPFQYPPIIRLPHQ